MKVVKPKHQVILTLKRLLFVWLFFVILPDTAQAQAQDTTATDRDTTRFVPYEPSTRPTFNPSDRYGDPFSETPYETPLFRDNADRLSLDLEIDTSLNYSIYERMGDMDYRPASTMTFEEFRQYQERQMLKSYWQTRSRALDGESAVSGRGFTPKIFVSPVLDRIFGGSYIELIPRGFVQLDFGAAFQRINNPAIPIRQQRNGGFEFDQQINMNVTGKIGEKLAVTANFDNNNSFDFQNNMKVEYTGYKEDILKKLEIGNVSLPLNNTLIQGAQNLFGVKAQMQFGKLNVTTIASTQRGKTSSIEIPGGNTGQGRPFEIISSNYDENRHFFLGHFFRDNYRNWIAIPPQVTSGVNVTRVEVYILNRNNDTQTLRNVVGLMDLGESRRVYNTGAINILNPNGPASNGANDLYSTVAGLNRSSEIDTQLEGIGLMNGTDYEKITGARKLAPTEYTYHAQLGYISLTRKLQNDEALAVAYEYTYNGQSFKVGELTEDYSNLRDDQVIYMKLLRPRKISIRDQQNRIIPSWDLMMKNIYALNVNQLVREGFELRVIYRDDRTGIDNPQLQEGQFVRNRQLIEIFGLDRLNPVNDPQRDGNFDFVENITINTQLGLIIFPYLEPFSQALREAFQPEPNQDFLIEKYAYDTLYRTTKAEAELFSTKNKFFITGSYSAGSSKEILIPGFGVAQGSVKVFAGGIPLIENAQYTVDYTFGKVTILDESILSSGKNISIQYEQSDPFAFQTRTLIGSRFDYALNEDVNLGSTVLYYNERPLVSRNQIGTEPARNLMYGADFNINKNSRVLTKIVDAIPILQTKEQSTINFSGEFAQLLPGTSNVIDGEGTAYLDDFENSATPYSLMSPQAWRLAAIPDDPRFDPTGGANVVEANYRRAKLAWYQVDNLFYRNNSGGGVPRPELEQGELDNHYVRAVEPQEIFPFRQVQQAVFNEPIFDVAYYPSERGPYNFNPSLNNNGFFNNPRDNWAGITTAIRTEVDFDKANIEYVEFWLLDPFINTQNGRIDDGINTPKSNTTGGKLIFQLGSISEDVMRDGRHAFENGLPADGNLTDGVTENSWGYVTTQQYITNAFDNSTSARENQDVGFDGITNDNESVKFQNFLDGLTTLNPPARERITRDPSADDFRYFLDDAFDSERAGVLERYKNYNGLEDNTPVAGNDLVARSGSPYPDNEDLNADNTLNELDEYYEYDIDLEPGDLSIGGEYIVDKVDVPPDVSGSDPVTWYLYRIPVREFENKFGNISGFKSIRYVRMMLTDFAEPVVLRFANFRMIGSRWRRYPQQLWEGGLIETPEPNLDNFTVSVVNLEENGQADVANNKSAYQIPPGVLRDRDNTSTVTRFLNEQSVQYCVDNLLDGDARAIYKNVEADLFNYGRIKMFLHMDTESEEDDLTAFIRLGTDFDQNYYEIEIPLVKSNVPETQTSDRAVWPEENEIDLDLNELTGLKVRRDREGFSLTEVFEKPELVGRHTIRILGRPDLSGVRTIMIGVRNPRSPDKRAHSACIWANELRLTDFNRTPGWAVNATMNAKLADFATVTGAFRHTTFGFGSVSSKIGERTRDETTAYDVAANVNVDKLLPGNTGIKIPMFVSYERNVSNPQFDPANPDVRLDATLRSFTSTVERDDYVKLIRDEGIRRSINFTNVRKVKVKPDAKTHLYDIENLSFSYSFSEATRTNFNIKEQLNQQHRASVAYNFSPKSTGIEPFKNAKWLDSKYLQLIKDFNIGFMPTNISVRADADRSFNKFIYRNDEGLADQSNFQKYFVMNRIYNVRWALSKALTLDYNARANAVIDEPEGELDTEEKRNTVIENLKKFGRMKQFDQSVAVNYALPLSKLPFTDWIGADYRYQASFNWRAGPLNTPDSISAQTGVQDIPDSLDFRHTIQNSRDQNFSGRLDLVKLYNKIKFLKAINTPKPSVRPTSTAGRPVQQRPPADTVRTTPGLVKGFFRLLMSLRSVTGTYTKTEGTILPGFDVTPWLFGMDKNWEAPGWNFILGDQDPNIRFKAAENGWLAQKTKLTLPFSQTVSTSINLRANIEPATDFRIQIDVKKDATSAYQEIFRWDPDNPAANDVGYASLGPNRSGSYRVSTLTIKTAFSGDSGEKESSTFDQFAENLDVIRGRFGAITGQPEFDSASQDVLIPAFIAAYTGQDANTISLSPFPNTPLPNWRIDYTGLSKMAGLRDVFQMVSITHGYSSSYAVVNYSSSTQYSDPGNLGLNIPIEDYNRRYFGVSDGGETIPVYQITQVMISEQFAPLVGINIRTKNRLTAKLEYRTKRDLALNISNAQVSELTNKDVAFEIGFTKNNMRLPFKAQGRTIILKNDLTFRMNLTVSDTKTIQRKLDELGTVTNGNINFQLRPNIDYSLNEKLNLRAYFERTINNPLISSSYRRSTTRFGVQVRFNLAQ